MNQPSQPPHAAPITKKSGAGKVVIVILVVIGVLVVGIGIFAALAVVGVKKYVANAKTGEAHNNVSMMAKSAVAAWELSDEPSATRTLCPSARAPIPAALSAVAAQKYQSSASEWAGDPGFSCLSFALAEPQYYQYDYSSSGREFSAKAIGDTDGNGTTSKFTLPGKVEGDAVVIAPAIEETNPNE